MLARCFSSHARRHPRRTASRNVPSATPGIEPHKANAPFTLPISRSSALPLSAFNSMFPNAQPNSCVNLAYALREFFRNLFVAIIERDFRPFPAMLHDFALPREKCPENSAQSESSERHIQELSSSRNVIHPRDLARTRSCFILCPPPQFGRRVM